MKLLKHTNTKIVIIGIILLISRLVMFECISKTNTFLGHYKASGATMNSNIDFMYDNRNLTSINFIPYISIIFDY